MEQQNRSKSRNQEVLENFDRLPDSASVRLPVVCGLLGVAPATVWRMAADGRIPKPHKLGTKITAWAVGELRQTMMGWQSWPSRKKVRSAAPGSIAATRNGIQDERHLSNHAWWHERRQHRHEQVICPCCA